MQIFLTPIRIPVFFAPEFCPFDFARDNPEPAEGLISGKKVFGLRVDQKTCRSFGRLGYPSTKLRASRQTPSFPISKEYDRTVSITFFLYQNIVLTFVYLRDTVRLC